MAVIDPVNMQLPRTVVTDPVDLKNISGLPPVYETPVAVGTNIVVTEGQDFPRGDGNS